MSDFGVLKNYIRGAAIKKLSNVEVNPKRSNQHEINGVQVLRDLFGIEKKELDAIFIRLNEHEETTAIESGTMTWYDAREGHPTRSEHRLYYSDPCPAIELAEEGDTLAIVCRQEGPVVLVTAASGTQPERCLEDLFGENSSTELMRSSVAFEEQEATHTRRHVLRLLGIEVTPTFGADYLAKIEAKFGTLKFPKTREFSELARELSPPLEDFQSADQAICNLWDVEEAMFTQLEEALVNKKLDEGFSNVADFIWSAKSILNRRNARAGGALENHLEAIFTSRGLSFDRGKRTENRKTPDFLFPSAEAYHTPSFCADNLTMLAVKTSCKDRWRQVLSEAERVPEKHLFTLEGGITEHQTDEMRASGLQLVVPSQIQTTFTKNQINWLWSLEGFITHLQ